MGVKTYSVYILTNWDNTVLYTGVTNNLVRRIGEHKSGLVPGFTQRYRIKKLVYCESFESIREAIAREKQLKAGSREKKMVLIHAINPNWDDLSDSLIG